MPWQAAGFYNSANGTQSYSYPACGFVSFGYKFVSASISFYLATNANYEIDIYNVSIDKMPSLSGDVALDANGTLSFDNKQWFSTQK